MRYDLLFLTIGLCAGCSSSSSSGSAAANDSLSCDWLDGQNCWKTTVAAAPSCAPPENETGTLSADGTSCSYAAGYVISFNIPVVIPAPIGTEPDWDFTIALNGQQCLHFVATGKSNVLTVGSDTVNEQVGTVSMDVTCPDGSHVSTANALSLLACPGVLNSTPGHSWTVARSSTAVGLTGAGSMSVPLFDCIQAN